MQRPSIQRAPLGHTSSGAFVEHFLLTNGARTTIGIMTYGATVTHLFTADRYGTLGDVVLSLPTLDAYESQSRYIGATIGRVANRIASARFMVDGTPHRLDTNDGAHHLHGGPLGYHRRVWAADATETADGPAVQLTLHDPDGAERYPGTVDVTVTYTLLEPAGLRITYDAVTDRATPLNLTNHSYFNLAGPSPTRRVDSHLLEIAADRYTPVDSQLIPTGEVAPVDGTPLDFRAPRPIGPASYDHNLVLASAPRALARAARASEPTTGRTMDVWTTEPGLQFYTMGSGGRFPAHGTFCLETQRWPDAVHHPHFPTTILRPGDRYQSMTAYRFGVDA